MGVAGYGKGSAGFAFFFGSPSAHVVHKQRMLGALVLSVLATYSDEVTLHLLKLCVGASSIADLEGFIAGRLAEKRAAGQPLEQVHTTRMVPKRIAEILDGGSLFWVIRGQITARQRMLDLRPFTDADGIGRCHLVLEPEVRPVAPRPCRPFQGWRYLPDESRPADLGLEGGAADMPEHLRYELRELCLI